MEAPTDETYWVAPRVLAGKYPGSRIEWEARHKVEGLINAGVRTFVDLTHEGDELLPYARLLPPGVEHHRVAVRDMACPSTDQVKTALDLIRAGTDRGAVYVHCLGGCGRTGVVIGCYLVEEGSPPEEALARVHRLTRALWDKRCPETPAQTAMVRDWKGSSNT